MVSLHSNYLLAIVKSPHDLAYRRYVMLHVFICEDDPVYREHIASIVRQYIDAEGCDMTLALAAGCPIEALCYLEAHPDACGLYFLDVDLGHEINGIALGAKIRDMGMPATIVFITTHEEMQHLVFKHKIEAMDYIVKDQPEGIEARVVECMEAAYKRYLDTGGVKCKYFDVKAGEQIWHIPYSDILFFETDTSMRHKMVLHMKDEQIKFRGLINDIAGIDPVFYRCHKSFVINVILVKRVDCKAYMVEMADGALVPIAAKKVRGLLALM